MNKAAFALTTLAALAIAPRALAQELTDHHEEEGSSGSAAPLPAQPPSGAEAPAETTITSAEPAAVVVTPPPARETVIARQTIRPNRPLLITGASMFVGSYVTTAVLTGAAVSRGANADKSLYIPVAGPWLHLADVTEGTPDMILIASSGVLQGAGAVLTLLSLIVPEKIPAARIEARGVEVNLSATSFGRGSAGLGAVGQF